MPHTEIMEKIRAYLSVRARGAGVRLEDVRAGNFRAIEIYCAVCPEYFGSVSTSADGRSVQALFSATTPMEVRTLVNQAMEAM